MSVVIAALMAAETLLVIWLLLDRKARARESRALTERLSFEGLLSQLTAGLIHVPNSELDAALEHALQEVVAFLGVDRGNLDEYVHGTSGVRISSASPGVDPLSRVLDESELPWTTRTLRLGKSVRFDRTDKLPEAVALDRPRYERMGTRSRVSVPLRAAGAVLGVLSLDSVRSERSWSDELVERLSLLGEAFASALERKRVELSLAERWRFERLLSSLASMLGPLPAADLDRELERALKLVTEHLGIDRADLIEFSRDGTGTGTRSIEEWITGAEFPWLMARLQRGEGVSISQLDGFPDDAVLDRRSYLTHEIKPQLALPLLAGRGVVGGLVLGTFNHEHPRPQELDEQLHLVGEVFANALARKQAELEAQGLRQNLTHIGRVSAMGELAASLAHELNQPLAAILTNAQAALRFLVSDPDNLDEIRDILRDIVADDKRAGDVIHRLRGLLKKADFEYVPLDLNDVLSEVARLVRNDAVIRNVSISLDLSPDVPRVRGDRVQLQQVVLNLVLNAFDAIQDSPSGDRTLAMRTDFDDSKTVRVAVHDSGTGIHEADLESLFEPLYTTKAVGLGMGLAIARTIVDAHGGRLGAENNTGGGAAFYFTLPVLQGTEE